MESMLNDDSPLACVLLEGHGLGEQFATDTETADIQSPSLDGSPVQFAPRYRNANGSQGRLRLRLGQPLRIAVPTHSPMTDIHQACKDAVSTHIALADTERFLEQFRYVIIASSLLNEQVSRSLFKPQIPALNHAAVSSSVVADQDSERTLQGAAHAIALPAVLAGLVAWLLTAVSVRQKAVRLLILLAVVFVAGFVLSASTRRQPLHSARQRACENVVALVANFQALDQSTSAALTLVREIELVSRGYRLSSVMMPAVTLMDNTNSGCPSRRCSRIRRSLHRLYTELISLMVDRCDALKERVFLDDLEKYLDIKEIAEPDVKEAFTGAHVSEIDDQECLSALRAMDWRLTTLRRVYLCHLLALPANGSTGDIIPWQAAVSGMQSLASITGSWAESINELLREDEQIPPSPSTPTHRSCPARDKIRVHLRKTNEFSADLRAIQAKFHILRDDASHMLDDAANPSAHVPLFTTTADSVAADLRGLLQSIDSWKASLSLSDRNAGGSSRPGSELRSPISLGGLTIVDEDSVLSSPKEALKILNHGSGEFTLSPSTTSDEEVFEALAVPKHRVLSRQDRLRKIADEEFRRVQAREQKLQTGAMVRELEQVISARGKKRTSTGMMRLGSSRVLSV